MKPLQLTVDNIAKAIFTVNRHAKTALNPSFLYLLKKNAIEKLLEEGKAKKRGPPFFPQSEIQPTTIRRACRRRRLLLPHPTDKTRFRRPSAPWLSQRFIPQPSSSDAAVRGKSHSHRLHRTEGKAGTKAETADKTRI